MGPRTKKQYSRIYSYIHVELEIWVKLYSWHYAQKLMFILGIFTRKHSSSQSYSLKTIFLVVALSLRISTLRIIFLLFILTLMNIRIGINNFLFFKVHFHQGKIVEAHACANNRIGRYHAYE